MNECRLVFKMKEKKTQESARNKSSPDLFWQVLYNIYSYCTVPYIDSLVFNLVISVTHFIVSSINFGMYNYQLDRHNFGIIGRWPNVAALSRPYSA